MAAQSSKNLDSCPICLQDITYPIRLPCSHIFCFLCAKGAVLQTSKCPMCRTAVSCSFFNNPELVEEDISLNVATFDGSFHWYYEGRNGWWLYDAHASQEIEKEFQNKQPRCEILIAGFMYIIDFENMVQYRKDIPLRTRKIKRDKKETKTKGIAGLRADVN